MGDKGRVTAGLGRGQESGVRRTEGSKEVGRKGGSVVFLGACWEPFRGVSRKSRFPLSNNLILTPSRGESPRKSARGLSFIDAP